MWPECFEINFGCEASPARYRHRQIKVEESTESIAIYKYDALYRPVEAKIDGVGKSAIYTTREFKYWRVKSSRTETNLPILTRTVFA